MPEANAKAVKAMEEIEAIVNRWTDGMITEREMNDGIHVVILRYQGLMAPPIIPDEPRQDIGRMMASLRLGTKK